jgi:putative DNA primase/helicase
MSVSAKQTAELHPDDLADLKRSGLSDETIAAMGCFSVDTETIRHLTGVTKVDSPGYFIPYAGIVDQTGEPYGRYRLRQPVEKMRYVAGRGDDPQLYIPPALADLPPSDLMVVTEGEKKANKAAQEGIHCVAVPGVWNGFDAGQRAVEKCAGDRVSEDTSPIPTLIDLAKKYKRVLVLGDSDLVTNRQARLGFELLTKSLVHRDVRAGLAFCPPATMHDDDGAKLKKQGIDDWLIADRFVATRSLRALFHSAEVNHAGISNSYNARALSELFGKKLAYSRGMWHFWNGSVWVADTYGERRRLVAGLGDLYSSIAADLDRLVGVATAPFASKGKKEYPLQLIAWKFPYDQAIAELRDAAKEIANLRGIDSALTLAQPLLHVEDDRWDRDPYLLAVRNGVVDLRTSEPRTAAPEQWITRMAGADYDPDAKAVAFLEFLEQVQPDPEIRKYLQCLAGYSAIGRANEQLFFIFVGGGANGKGTYMGVMMDALGEYAVKGPLSVLAQQDPGRIRNDLAMLAGARLVSISETPENFSLDEATIKAVTGQDIITARFLNKEFFSYRPCFTPILDTNHAPRLRDTGEGLWRRPVIVPWPVKIPKLQRDLGLREKLLAELPGILAWTIAGAKAYIKEGLPTLPQIAEATQALRSSCDDLARWLESCVEQGELYSVQSTPLYENYRAWSQAEGTPALSQPKFTLRLAERMGSEPKKRHGKMFWNGLRPLDWETETNTREGHALATAQGSQTIVIARKTTDATLPSPGYVPTPEELQHMPGGSLLI